MLYTCTNNMANLTTVQCARWSYAENTIIKSLSLVVFAFFPAKNPLKISIKWRHIGSKCSKKEKMQRFHYCDCFKAAIIDFWENICVNFQVQSVWMQTHKRKSYERVNLECRIWYCLCMRAKSIKWFNVESSYSSILEKKQ